MKFPVTWSASKSVKTAILSRLHMQFLHQYINGTTFHLFTDDLFMILTNSLEKKFSRNIIDLKSSSRMWMIQIRNSPMITLYQSTQPNKAMLIYNQYTVTSSPEVAYQSQNIAFVKNFRQLGMNISEVRMGLIHKWTSQNHQKNL